MRRMTIEEMIEENNIERYYFLLPFGTYGAKRAGSGRKGDQGPHEILSKPSEFDAVCRCFDCLFAFGRISPFGSGDSVFLPETCHCHPSLGGSKTKIKTDCDENFFVSTDEHVKKVLSCFGQDNIEEIIIAKALKLANDAGLKVNVKRSLAQIEKGLEDSLNMIIYQFNRKLKRGKF